MNANNDKLNIALNEALEFLDKEIFKKEPNEDIIDKVRKIMQISAIPFAILKLSGEELTLDQLDDVFNGEMTRYKVVGQLLSEGALEEGLFNDEAIDRLNELLEEHVKTKTLH